MRIALFITCLNDTLFPGVGKATVTVLERLGHEVVFPREQTCCGQMHANTGYRREAVPLVRRFVRAFSEAEVDAVVGPSGSCVAMVRDQYGDLAREAGDARLEGDVAALAPRVFELSQFLVGELGIVDVGAYFPHRVTYHPTCHSLRLLRVGDAPLRLLR
jgi:L-lactate dehydrogenase complex protein LldE